MKYKLKIVVELDENTTKKAAKLIKNTLAKVSKDVYIHVCEIEDKDCQFCGLKICNGCRGTYGV